MNAPYSSSPVLSQKGSALFIVLIATALFGALSFAVANMMRNDGGIKLSDEKAGLYADEILDYGRAILQAVQHIRISNGCEDTDISFQNDVVSGYTNGTNTDCQVFSTDGGGMNWVSPSETYLDATFSGQTGYGYGKWSYSSVHCIQGIGNCGSAAQLIAYLSHVQESVCMAINERLGIGSGSISTDDWSYADTLNKFTGSYPVPEVLSSADINGQSAGCFQDNIGASTGAYIFYQVLIAR